MHFTNFGREILFKFSAIVIVIENGIGDPTSNWESHDSILLHINPFSDHLMLNQDISISDCLQYLLLLKWSLI